MLHLPTMMLMGGGGPAVGQQLFRSGGSFVVPGGITTICAVAIGAGSMGNRDQWYNSNSGGGGGLSYRNAIGVTAGETISVDISQAKASIRRSSTLLLSANGAFMTAIAGAAADTGGGQWVGFAGGDGEATANYGEPPALGKANLAGGGAGRYSSNGVYASGAVSLLGSGMSGSLAGEGARLDHDTGGYPSALIGGGIAGVRIIWGSERAYPNTNTGDA